MNYFCHAFLHLDRPYFVAGTAVPDWLSVVHRRVRMRSPRVTPFADGTGTPVAELAAGILQHIADDHWFHGTPEFLQVSETLAKQFRGLFPDIYDHRPGFLGHIVTELLLDRVLIERYPQHLDEYYSVLQKVDPQQIELAVNQMAPRPAERLAEFIPLFHAERFLYDYVSPVQLLRRLNQVMRRVTLPQLPDGTVSVLQDAWQIVERNAPRLLVGLGNVVEPVHRQ